jgi:uncharacterized membrane protein
VLQALLKYFLRGLLVVVPVTVTIYIVWLVVTTLDRWVKIDTILPRPVPGAGLVLTLALITVVGFLAGNFATRWVFRSLDELLVRLPFVKLIYASLRDLMDAFVGDRKRFGNPVRVFLESGGGLAVLAFQTRDDLAPLGLPDHVAVYFPQSYNFAGNVFAVPRSRVEVLDADSTMVMTFIVSGGVTGELDRRSAANPA